MVGREVDFVITERRMPITGRGAGDPAVRYLKTRFPDCPTWQIHAEGPKDYQTSEGIRVAPAPVLLRTLV